MIDNWTLLHGVFCTGLGAWTAVHLVRAFRKEPPRDLQAISLSILFVAFSGLILNDGLNSLSLYFRGVGWMGEKFVHDLMEIMKGLFLVLMIIHVVRESSLTLRRRRDREADAARGPRMVKRAHGAKPPASVNPPAKTEEAAE